MISKEDFIVLHELRNKGYSVRQIAKIMKLNRRTIARHLQEETLVKTKRATKRLSKLEPYKPYIRDLISKSNQRLPWSAIMDDICELGYCGGRSILQELLTEEYRAMEIKSDPIVRFETEPGKQAQADWTTIRSGKNPIYAFVMTLGYSRMSFIWFSTSCTDDDLVACLDRSFAYFNGIPEHILYDNMKDVVIKRDAYGEGEHKFNATLLEFAKFHGFDIKLCKPYRAKTKGKVERFNGYLKGNFYRYLKAKLKGTPIEITAELLNSQIYSWTVKANKRIHGTTKERPIVRFEIEQPLLLPYVVRKIELNLAHKLSAITTPKPRNMASSLEMVAIVQPSLSEYDGLLGADHYG
ncbi:MAG: IS21 family transposase [Burkholderiales bacterium]